MRPFPSLDSFESGQVEGEDLAFIFVMPKAWQLEKIMEFYGKV